MKVIAQLVGFLAVLAVLVGATEGPAVAAPESPRPAADCGVKVLKATGEAWRCSFVDDFNGNALDAGKWRALTTTATNLPGKGDCWVDDPDNITVSGGFLRLTTRRTESPFTCTKADGTTYESEVSSGGVSTVGGFAQAYGRWDIRARFPEVTLPGSQGALWLTPHRNTYGPWPASGEIDIAAFYSLYPDRVVPHIHYKPSSPDSTVTNTRCFVPDPWSFHTYSVVWSPGRIVISIDGKTCVDHKVHAAKPLQGSQPFDEPFVLNITQTLGVGTNAPLAGTPLPLTTEVDYVRAWR